MPETRTCPVHGVPMQEYSKGAERWWAHRTPAGDWCHGEAQYDAEAINARVDLVDLIGHDTELVKLTGKNGGEHAAPCPKCGGTDRFHCTPTWWFCRQCHEKRGDAIAYLQWRDGLSFAEACEKLGGGALLAIAPTKQQRAPEPVPPPGDAWQERARALVAYAHDQLWGDVEALAYLRERGLSDETIEAARLGYNPKMIRDDPARWGLDGQRVYIARGWVIPSESDGVIRYVKVRRRDDDLQGEYARTGKEPAKYLAIRGSRLTLFGLDDLRGRTDGILCEGEYDALLLRQHVGEVCGVAALGSASKSLGADALTVLCGVRRVYAALDSDKAGQDGAERLAGMSERVRVIPTPCGEHDVTDAWRSDCDLRAWALSHIGPSDLDKRGDWLLAMVARVEGQLRGAEHSAGPWLKGIRRGLYEELGRLDAQT